MTDNLLAGRFETEHKVSEEIAAWIKAENQIDKEKAKSIPKVGGDDEKQIPVCLQDS